MQNLGMRGGEKVKPPLRFTSSLSCSSIFTYVALVTLLVVPLNRKPQVRSSEKSGNEALPILLPTLRDG